MRQQGSAVDSRRRLTKFTMLVS